jgi:hypothetical protein
MQTGAIIMVAEVNMLYAEYDEGLCSGIMLRKFAERYRVEFMLRIMAKHFNELLH